MSSRLSAVLDLDLAQARAQWERVRARERRSRQEPFLPIEVILCYGLFRLIDPHRFGGSNIGSIPAEVAALASTLQRSPGSLTNKMLNLDGSRPNAAKDEPELFLRLSVEPDRFAALYLLVIHAAREAGLDERQVPDLLEGLEVDEIPMLGQDELGSRELALIADEQRDEIQRIHTDFDLPEPATTRIVEQRVRLGQHRFATAVLRNYDHRCAFCGFAPRRLARHRMLVASHIKPWAVSSPRERLDVRNGIAACPMHDSAFDSGLITVNGGLRVHRADLLDRSILEDARVGYYFEEPALQDRLLLPEGGRRPADIYLKYHREQRFRGKADWELAKAGVRPLRRPPHP